ncbi:hypothetical protein VTJ04DRAFT_608 [Mycothermus thermophilus]|uniref:uncharacterized protein n=1 Tax=Humicola insolens TaxID=85995 RepID=UPI0037440685
MAANLDLSNPRRPRQARNGNSIFASLPLLSSRQHEKVNLQLLYLKKKRYLSPLSAMQAREWGERTHQATTTANCPPPTVCYYKAEWGQQRQ